MTGSVLDEFVPYLTAMMKNPPDPNAPLPLGNRPSTVYGVTIPFQILCWVAVGFRLHTRLRVVREPGLDDAFVVISTVFKLVTVIAFYGGLEEGFGKHLVNIIDILAPTMIWFYITNAGYVTTAVCIKLSLLCQYLRLFREGYRRTMTFALLVVVALWGAAFFFMAWFPCFPISGFWNKNMVPQARCYGFGYRTINEAKNTLFAFSGSNMILDVAIFLVPLTEYLKPGLKRKQVLAMTGLFGLGAIVILMAFLRLWSGLKYNNQMTMFDFTWWMPEVLIFSCLEIDFAIMCASMPIFWPSVLAAWTDIFITQEVTVVHDRRSRYVEVNELNLQLDRVDSKKSQDSAVALTQANTEQVKPFFTSFDPETGRGPGSGISLVEVQTPAQTERHVK